MPEGGRAWQRSSRYSITTRSSCTMRSRALLLLGKGIGFGRRINEQLEIGKAEGCSVYELQQKTSKGETRDVLRSMDPLYLEISAEIVELAEREFGEIDRNILVPLADHIAFALTRIRSKMNITNPFSNDIRLVSAVCR